MIPKPVPRNRRPATDKKFSRILSAAVKVFSKTGFEKASIRMVAAKAKVSLAGIYYHVHSKEELLFLIQYKAFHTILENLKTTQADLGDCAPAERLHAMIRNHLDYFLGNLDDLRICSRELDILTGAFYKKVAEVRREYFKMTLDIVKDISRSEGSASRKSAKGAAVDPRTATLCLFGMLNWVYTWYDPEKDTPHSLAVQLLQLYLHGVHPAIDGEK